MEALIIAGETSGDIHAANILKSFKKKKEIKFFGIGGERMMKEGCEIIYPMDRIEVIGFLEPILKLKEILYARNFLIKKIKERKPEFAILVDFPGFNLSFAGILKKLNIPVFYFVAPQIWAWGKSRILKIKEYVKHIYPVLPFEKEIFDKENVDSSYFGNPLLDIVEIKNEIKRNDFKEYEKIIALLPGSREKEIKILLPLIIDGFKIYRGNKKILGIIALSNEKYKIYVQDKINGEKDIKIFCGKTYDVLNISDAAIISSGTATLESGIIGTPMVVVYKLSNLSYFFARFLTNVKYVSLVNIILNDSVVPELIQKFRPEDIARKIEFVLKNSSFIKDKFKILKTKLGQKGVYDRVVDDIIHRI